MQNILTEKIGRTVYTVTCHFKANTKTTLSEKLLKIMSKGLESTENVCYNDYKSQNSLDCKQERSSL